MSVVDQLARQASRIANDVQVSLKRARVEGERRLLQRQHRAALEELGLRAYELVRAGELPEDPLASEVAAVDAKLIELDANEREIADLQSVEEHEADDGNVVDAAFPMVGRDTPAGPDAPRSPNPGPGWEAANRFFRSDR